MHLFLCLWFVNCLNKKSSYSSVVVFYCRGVSKGSESMCKLTQVTLRFSINWCFHLTIVKATQTGKMLHTECFKWTYDRDCNVSTKTIADNFIGLKNHSTLVFLLIFQISANAQSSSWQRCYQEAQKKAICIFRLLSNCPPFSKKKIPERKIQGASHFGAFEWFKKNADKIIDQKWDNGQNKYFI